MGGGLFMSGIEVTNILIGLLIAIIGYVWQRFEKRMDKFEQTVQNILLSDISHQKDIDSLKENYKDHETRITKLEDERL
jgi:uncharacterized membrane-anchored protein YhcB (DUF1043 family)